MEEKGFVVACKAFFGMMPGQNLQQFKDEVRALTDADVKELAPMLARELGYPVRDSILAK